ncbi:MAG TPA: DUF72 domain-containing protein [Kiritimatiellia bacterium]|nr:DUF72 domain-containing protein [Kiritimatiellia bacterium]HRZ13291.1 DUF72 domain-containing protein [Kiritimatiellia bacterium]HSA18740.1 DUF72 domain-containing protein [Kiritimatiellia bacterium]
MSEAPGSIRVGVAGWSYPDWEGFVYSRREKDKLRFVAGYLDLIEINSTFYRPPAAKTAGAWVRQTADLPEFFFSAKLHRDFTHEGRFSEAAARAFLDGLKPILDAGRLRHILAQFPFTFAESPEARSLLRAITESLRGTAALVLELRHRSWQASAALEFLVGLGVTVANLDYPVGKDSFDLRECRIGEHGYLRLHGRNRVAWFDRKAGRNETYNYLYSKPEVDDIRARAVSLAKTFRSLTIVANNHYQGKEVANALQLKAMLSGQKVRVPPDLLRQYPELAEVARERNPHEDGALF